MRGISEPEKTPKSRIVQALRYLWLRSRERAAAMKRDGYSCQKCGIKASRAGGEVIKVEVHHKEGINNWDEIIESIRNNLLCDIKHLETLCKECHKKEK